jgi:hypothetical protein
MVDFRGKPKNKSVCGVWPRPEMALPAADIIY